MSGIQRTALLLAIIGAVNWGLIGFFRFDLVAAIFGGQAAGISRLIYAVVGLAGIYCISILFKPSEEMERSPEPQR
ncbi:DUF378 domain-containing protein [Texcoconibacillus texcoconensis]|uniref:DUF378 domain-containing protein n=1 Tax=Texcoconibacillus texcoconensis TaxID=1095777 RepID=A0A840QN97_9BACI|nr:DUF378 domain-containing protein [Texcoconibacillus texcoconensis]MBB5172855.1 hypothetical protein [Texcoconibacillus texcoconensis]